MNVTLLSARQVSQGWRISEVTLARFRIHGNGPPFIKIGRSVRYDRDDLEKWLTSLKRKSTSEAA